MSETFENSVLIRKNFLFSFSVWLFRWSSQILAGTKTAKNPENSAPNNRSLSTSYLLLHLSFVTI